MILIPFILILFLVTACGVVSFPHTSCEQSLSGALRQIENARSTALSSGTSTLASLNLAKDYIEDAQEVCK